MNIIGKNNGSTWEVVSHWWRFAQGTLRKIKIITMLFHCLVIMGRGPSVLPHPQSIFKSIIDEP